MNYLEFSEVWYTTIVFGSIVIIPSWFWLSNKLWGSASKKKKPKYTEKRVTYVYDGD